jgi:DNA mismatch repair protein MSH6
VLHHIATHVGCVGFFATHYHSLASEFASHPEILAQRMAIHVDEAARHVMFLYQLEEGVAEGSFGMHCAAMCGIKREIVERAEDAAREWEFTGKLKTKAEDQRGVGELPLGMLSDVSWMLRCADGGAGIQDGEQGVGERGLEVLRQAIAAL